MFQIAQHAREDLVFANAIPFQTNPAYNQPAIYSNAGNALAIRINGNNVTFSDGIVFDNRNNLLLDFGVCFDFNNYKYLVFFSLNDCNSMCDIAISSWIATRYLFNRTTEHQNQLSNLKWAFICHKVQPHSPQIKFRKFFTTANLIGRRQVELDISTLSAHAKLFRPLGI